MKKIIIGFSRPQSHKPFADAIMWWDKTNYSHGYLRFPSVRWDTSFIYQNAGHQTHFMSEERFKEINVIVEEYTIEVTDEMEAKLGKLCVSREGKSYGLKQVTGISIAILVKILTFGRISIKNPFADGDLTTDCIEEVGKILAEGAGLPCPLDLDTASVKPFRDWVAGLPQAIRIP